MTDDLEGLLRELPLRAPGASLDGRMARLLRRPRRWPVAAALAAAAVLAVGVGLCPWWAPRPAESHLPATASGEAPAPTVRTWTNASYEGWVPQDDRPALRVYRQRTVQELRWVDADLHGTVEVTVPAEQYVLVQAGMY